MKRQTPDEVRQKIDAWEQLRADLDGTSARPVLRHINAELNRLRYEKWRLDDAVANSEPTSLSVGDPEPKLR